MTNWEKVKTVFSSVLVIACSILMMLLPEEGHYFVIAILCVVLLLRGLRDLVYYFSMGRYQVGGKIILYKGIIIFDLGLFTFGLSDLPQQYVMLYLLAYYIFTGGINILRAREAKSLGAPWKFKMLSGIFCLGISALCILNFGSNEVMLYILCSGFIYSAILRCFVVLRRNAIVYIA